MESEKHGIEKLILFGSWNGVGGGTGVGNETNIGKGKYAPNCSQSETYLEEDL